MAFGTRHGACRVELLLLLRLRLLLLLVVLLKRRSTSYRRARGLWPHLWTGKASR